MEIRQMLLLLFLGANGLCDIRKKEIPIILIVIFGIISLPLNKWTRQLTWYEIYLGALVGVVFLIISKFTAESIGYGDGFVILIMGLYAGIWDILSILFWGLLLVSAISVLLVFVKKKSWKTKIPFVPFLLFSYVASLVF